MSSRVGIRSGILARPAGLEVAAWPGTLGKLFWAALTGGGVRVLDSSMCLGGDGRGEPLVSHVHMRELFTFWAPAQPRAETRWQDQALDGKEGEFSKGRARCSGLVLPGQTKRACGEELRQWLFSPIWRRGAIPSHDLGGMIGFAVAHRPQVEFWGSAVVLIGACQEQLPPRPVFEIFHDPSRASDRSSSMLSVRSTSYNNNKS